MKIESTSGVSVGQKAHTATVTISRWVNEPLPNIHELLCSRDLARLTRRSWWELLGLSFIGKLPRKKRYRGRAVGWCRAEVLEWMARDLAVALETPRRLNSTRHCARQHPRQACLPLECRGPCAARREGQRRG